jgi:hypothetical protein
MKRNTRWIWAAIILWITGCLWAQTPDIAGQKRDILRLEARLDTLRILRSGWENEGKMLAQRIALANRAEDRSITEHRELEKLMQQSQKLDQNIRGAEQAIAKIATTRDNAISKLVKDLQTAMDQLMASAENASGTANRDQLLIQLNQVMAEKNRWEARISRQTHSPDPTFYVDINPWDNPDDIRMKRDVLLDQEEAVRHEIKGLDKQIKSMRDEENMRRKMADLSGELNLFNESEEIMDRNIAYRGHQDNDAVFDDDATYESIVTAPASRNPESNSKDFSGWYDENTSPAFTPLQSGWEGATPEDNPSLSLEDRIAIMKKYRTHLSQRADSLNQRAQDFEAKIQTP